MQTFVQVVQWDLVVRILVTILVSVVVGFGLSFICYIVNEPYYRLLHWLFSGLNVFGGLGLFLGVGLFFFIVGLNTYGATIPNPAITHGESLIGFSHRIALMSAPVFGVGFGFKLGANEGTG